MRHLMKAKSISVSLRDESCRHFHLLIITVGWTLSDGRFCPKNMKSLILLFLYANHQRTSVYICLCSYMLFQYLKKQYLRCSFWASVRQIFIIWVVCIKIDQNLENHGFGCPIFTEPGTDVIIILKRCWFTYLKTLFKVLAILAKFSW